MSILILENYIKSIIEENQINTLHVYDFDMTLYNHNKKNWFDEVLNELNNSLSNPKIRTILCTARSKNADYIFKTESMLKKKGMSLLDFDECYFKSDNRKEKVSIYKSCVILDEICSNSNLINVKFWDDRKETLDQVKVDLENHERIIEYTPIKC